MNKIRSNKATNAAQRHTPVVAGPPLMTVVTPPVELSEQGRVWQQEIRAAIDCYNEWIAEHGLPLEEFRRF